MKIHQVDIEPYSILLDTKSLTIIRKDMQRFHEAHINTFINRLICNHHETYTQSHFTGIVVKDVLKEHDPKITDDVASELAEKIKNRLAPPKLKIATASNRLSLRLDSAAKTVLILDFQFVNNPSNYTVEKFVKGLVLDYVRLSFLERERIYLRRDIDTILNAIIIRNVLHIATDTAKYKIEPLAIVEALDEYGNYLIGYSRLENKYYELLIRNIRALQHSGEHFVLTEEVRKKIRSVEKNGVRHFTEKELHALRILTDKRTAPVLLALMSRATKTTGMNIHESDLIDLASILTNYDIELSKDAEYLPVVG